MSNIIDQPGHHHHHHRHPCPSLAPSLLDRETIEKIQIAARNIPRSLSLALSSSLSLSIRERRSIRAVDPDERSPRLVEARLVARLPYLRERDRAVEPVEDAEREGDPLHDGPREEPVEIELDRVRHHFLRLERVDHPHGQVADEQEGDHLPAWLATIVLGQVDPSAGHVRDEQHLEDDLGHGEEACQHDEEVGLVGEGCQRAGDHAEHRVHEQAEARHAEEDVVQVALLLGLELQALHPYETDDYGHDREDHEHAVGHVREVNGDQAQVRMVDQHEEEDQADQRADQQQQAEEQSFARSYTVHPCVTYFFFASRDTQLLVSLLFSRPIFERAEWMVRENMRNTRYNNYPHEPTRPLFGTAWPRAAAPDLLPPDAANGDVGRCVSTSRRSPPRRSDCTRL